MRKTQQTPSRERRNKKKERAVALSEMRYKQDKQVVREGQGNETRHKRKRTDSSKRKVRTRRLNCSVICNVKYSNMALTCISVQKKYREANINRQAVLLRRINIYLLF